MSIEIEVTPAAGNGRERYTAFTAEGRQLVAATPNPFFAAARALLAEGTDPATPIHLRHRGSAVLAMRSTVGAAAKLTVREGDTESVHLTVYSPFPGHFAGGA